MVLAQVPAFWCRLPSQRGTSGASSSMGIRREASALGCCGWRARQQKQADGAGGHGQPACGACYFCCCLPLLQTPAPVPTHSVSYGSRTQATLPPFLPLVYRLAPRCRVFTQSCYCGLTRPPTRLQCEIKKKKKTLSPQRLPVCPSLPAARPLRARWKASLFAPRKRR